MKSWLGDSIQGFIDALAQGKLQVDGMDPDKQAQLLEQAEDLKNAAEEAGDIAHLAAALTDLIVVKY